MQTKTILHQQVESTMSTLKWTRQEPRSDSYAGALDQTNLVPLVKLDDGRLCTLAYIAVIHYLTGAGYGATVTILISLRRQQSNITCVTLLRLKPEQI